MYIESREILLIFLRLIVEEVSDVPEVGYLFFVDFSMDKNERIIECGGILVLFENFSSIDCLPFFSPDAFMRWWWCTYTCPLTNELCASWGLVVSFHGCQLIFIESDWIYRTKTSSFHIRNEIFNQGIFF